MNKQWIICDASMASKYNQIELNSMNKQLALEYNSIATYVQLYSANQPQEKESLEMMWPKMQALASGTSSFPTWMSAASVVQCTVAFSLTFSIVFTNLLVLLVRIRNKRLRKQVRVKVFFHINYNK